MTQDPTPQASQDLVETPVPRRELPVAAGNPVFQVVFEDFRQRLRSGEWLPGGRLPSITRLAQELAVSTASVREALRSLQSIGLVKIEHGRGVFVTASRPATDLSSHFQDVSTGMIVALAETRRILEPELAALAAERGSEKELDAIDGLAREMEQGAQLGVDFAEPDVQFHQQIAQAARNPILFRLMESVNDLLLESRRLTVGEPGMTVRAVRYHLLIAEAIRARNIVQSRLLMLAHMNDMLSGVLAAEAKHHAQATERVGENSP